MCLVIDKITKIRKPRTGFIIRKKASNGVLTPVYNDNILCRGKIGDTITDPNWTADSYPFEVGQGIEIGCLHVFKNKREAIKAMHSCYFYEDKVIVQVSITPGLLLIGYTLRFNSELDPLPCYGCESYLLKKIVRTFEYQKGKKNAKS